MLRRIATLTAVTAATLALAAAPATAFDTDVITTAPDAIGQTSVANLAHAQDVAANALNPISCRVEAAVFVDQPEYDGRVTVKGEDTAATAAVCVDLTLSESYTASVRLFIEYFDPKTRTWMPILDAEGKAIANVCSFGSVRGVAVVPCVLNAVLTANNPASGKLHRAGTELLVPYPMSPLYTLSPLAVAGQGVKAIAVEGAA